MSTTTAPTEPSSFQMPAHTPEHQATQRIADRFVELVSAGKNLEAIRELYADNARHVEVMDAPWCPRITDGKASVTQRAEQFASSTIIHAATIGKPIVNGDQFVCPMTLDCTAKEGPMANQRMNMSETALYTVKNGKITEGKFFYSCGM